ncbi:hypothetical protein BH09MYX1_BH09MYX1_48710 [soil metagenome]
MSKRVGLGAAILVAALGMTGTASAADPKPTTDTAPRALSVDPWISLGIIGVGGVSWVGSELAKSSLVATQCRWCDRRSGVDSLLGIDESTRNALRWSTPGTAATISDVMGFGALPVLLLGGLIGASARDGAWRKIPEDLLVVVETVILAADMNQAVKFAVQRERPLAYALAPQDKGSTAQPSDNNLSFYSGHTSLAFSLATSTGMVASLRGYSFAPLIWGVGLPLAAFEGYLRIAADKHYLTDVITGALFGAAFGIAVPLLHRAEVGRGVMIVPQGAGAALVVTM